MKKALQIYCDDEMRQLVKEYSEKLGISESSTVKTIIAEKLRK